MRTNVLDADIHFQQLLTIENVSGQILYNRLINFNEAVHDAIDRVVRRIEDVGKNGNLSKEDAMAIVKKEFKNSDIDSHVKAVENAIERIRY